MAIKYKELKEKLENDPLTNEELNLIGSIELWIDEEIRRTFGKTYYEAWIDKSIVTFNWNPNTKKHIDVREPRRHVMRKELERRYTEAGWKIEWPDDMDNSHVKFKGQ
jgi:hypothetical protein